MKILCLLLLLICTEAAFADPPAASMMHRVDMTESAWSVFGPGAPIATLAAQIQQESNWKCQVVSWAGAQGCAQFMPGTATDIAKRWPEHCAPVNTFDGPWSFRCRDRYLQSNINGLRTPIMSECDAWAFGLKAYNGGRTWVKRDMAATLVAGKNPNNWLHVSEFNSGRKPSAFKENKEYPERIFKLESNYYSWGIGLECLN